MRNHLRMLRHFSIRDLLWLTVVAAVAVGWFQEQTTLARRMADMTQRWDAKEKELRQHLAMLQQKEKIVDTTLEAYRQMNKLQDERHAREVARLNAQLDQFMRPGYSFEAEPGVYFLAPVR